MAFVNARSAIEQLWANRLRSSLTVVGIVIAVTSTITVVSVVQGFTTYVSEFLQGLGTNAAWIFPRRPPGEAGKALGRVEMNLADYEAIRDGCEALKATSPLVSNRAARARLRGDEVVVPVEGVAPEYHAIRNLTVELGRPFSLLDVENGHFVCVMGREAIRKLEADDGVLDDFVSIDGRRFRVIGILKEKGGFLGENQDDLILIPYTSALRMYPQFLRNLAVTAQTVSEDAVLEAKAQIVSTLRRRHGLDAGQPNDFVVLTQDEILEAFQTMSLAATALLAGIVGISLLVGGIGIMNVMLVNVTERTREIGLRKALGARRRDILAQFLTEATTLSLAGGGLGILLGYALSHLASAHPSMVDVSVPWWAVALGFGFSAGIGVVFGVVPAMKAALLNPIDALRHE